MLENLYGNAAVVNQLVDAFNEQHTGKISTAERGLLLKDASLTEAVFRGSISDLIGDGHISVQELVNKPELQNVLQNELVRAAIYDGVVSTGQLQKLPPKTLDAISETLVVASDQNISKAAALLGLDAEKTQFFQDSVAKALKPSVDYDIILPPSETPPPQQYNPDNHLLTRRFQITQI